MDWFVGLFFCRGPWEAAGDVTGVGAGARGWGGETGVRMRFVGSPTGACFGVLIDSGETLGLASTGLKTVEALRADSSNNRKKQGMRLADLVRDAKCPHHYL